MIPISEKLPDRAIEKSESKRPKEGHFKSVYNRALQETDADKEQEELLSPLGLMQPPLFAAAAGSAQTVAAVSAPVQVAEVFEEMIAAMTSLHEKGDLEVTFFLNAPHSVFSGTQIVIKEFSTAPKAFNVEFIGSPQAVALFQSNMGELVRTFHAEERPFKINRLDAHLADKQKPLVHRKESISEEQRGQDETV